MGNAIFGRRQGKVCIGMAVAVCCVVLLSAQAGAADRLTFDLDELGSVSGWLVSQPITLKPGKDFTEDLLPEFGGEAKLRPNGLVSESGGRRIDWRVVFGATPLINAEKQVPRARTVYYMSAFVTPAETERYTLTCQYWSDVTIWINGEKIIDGRRESSLYRSVKAAEYNFEQGRDYHILVKLGSGQGHAVSLVRLTDGPEAMGRPAKMSCSLPVAADDSALASYLPEALDISIDNYRFFEPDRTAHLQIGTSAARSLPPGLNSGVTAKARITTREGKRLEMEKPRGGKTKYLDLGELTPEMFAQATTVFKYQPSKNELSPYYRVEIDLFHDGKPAGSFHRDFYCIEGIRELGERIADRAERFYRETYREQGMDAVYADRNLAYLLLKVEELKLLYDTEHTSSDFGRRALDFVLDGQERVEIMEKRLEVQPTPGMHEFGYTSRVDDSAQPYYIYMPRSYDQLAGAPLIIYLHGYAPDLNKINWQLIPQGLLDLCEKYGYVLAAPFARSNTDFQGIGEEDVMHVLDLVLNDFGLNIHRDRVFLLGYSMGGSGAYTIASHYPDRWAGTIALCGRADYYLWKNAERDKVLPFKQWLIGLEFGGEVAENFRNLPLLAIQGERDSLVKVEQSRRMIGKLKDMGYDASFFTVKDEDHWISQPVFSTDMVFEWMEKQRRPQTPAKITYATYSLKYNKTYWAAIDDFRKWGERAVIDVEVTGDNEIAVEETNVAAFMLEPPAKLIDTSKPVLVKAGGKQFKFQPPFDKPLKVVLDPPRETPLRKTPLLCGPYKDVHNSRFIFVYGTQGNPVVNKNLYEQATQLVDEWRDFTKAVQLFKKEKDPLMVRDRDLDDEMKSTCNLVLIGTPATNSVLASIAGKLPITIKDETTYVVGDRTLKGENLGLVMVYPSPFAPGRYVAVRSGRHYGDSLSVNHKYDLLPDFIIHDKGVDRDIHSYYDGKADRMRCAGYFNKYWELDDSLTWEQEPGGDDEPVPWWR